MVKALYIEPAATATSSKNKARLIVKQNTTIPLTFADIF
jgi:hypothetical protein